MIQKKNKFLSAKFTLWFFLLLVLASHSIDHKPLSARTDFSAKRETTIVFILSSQLKQFQNVLTSFRESYPEVRLLQLTLTKQQSENQIARFLKQKKPDIIVTLGALAATQTARIEKTKPVIFSMVINYHRYPELKQNNVTGISMEIPPTVLLTQFRMIFPQLKNIAIPYNPATTGEIVNSLIPIAQNMGITITPIAVTNDQNFRDRLLNQQSPANALWMLADFHLYNNRTQNHQILIEYAIRKKYPLLAVSEAFVRIGALYSISINYNSLGSQLALISRRIALDGEKSSNIAIASPIGSYSVINRDTAEKIWNEKNLDRIINFVDKIYPENDKP